MLRESDQTPEPGENRPASPSNGQPKPCPPPAGSPAERVEIAKAIGYPGAALLTYSDVASECRRLLLWEC